MFWDDYDEPKRNRMDGKRKHPFSITCRMCGSKSVKVIPYEYGDLGIECNSCGYSLNCGTYYTDKGDYSEYGMQTM